MFGLGMQELLVLLLIVLILFGGRKLPELASGLGKAIKNFKKGMSEPDEIDVTPGKKTAEDDKSKAEGEKKS